MKHYLDLILVSVVIFVNVILIAVLFYFGLESQSFADEVAIPQRLRGHMIYSMPHGRSPEGYTVFGVAEPVVASEVNGRSLILYSSRGRRIEVPFSTPARAQSARTQLIRGGSIDLSACTTMGTQVSAPQSDYEREDYQDGCADTFYRLQPHNCEIYHDTPVWFALDARLFDINEEGSSQLVVQKQVCRQTDPLPWNY